MLKSDKFKGLAIEGGGVAGITYLGCLRAWVAQGHSLNQWTYFCGSSAGSMLAAFLALRAPIEWLDLKFKNTDFSQFSVNSWFRVKEVMRFNSSYGLHGIENLKNWIRNSINDLTGNPDITFQEVYDRFETHLIITKTDILYPSCKLVVMDKNSHPDTSIADAVLASCSIPGYFESYIGGSETVKEAEKNHIFVDGGVLLNYPIELLYKYLEKKEVMGLYLSTPEEKFSSETGEFEETLRPIENHMEFIMSIVNSLHRLTVHRHVNSNDWNRTCDIEVCLDSTNFNITSDEKEAAILCGYKGMITFLEKYDKSKIEI